MSRDIFTTQTTRYRNTGLKQTEDERETQAEWLLQGHSNVK